MHNIAIVGCHFNPCKYKRIVKNHLRWKEHFKDYDIFTAEVSYDGEFETNATWQINGTERNIMFQKERMFNYCREKLPAKYDAVLYCDADFEFYREDWYAQAQKLLQRKECIQPFDRVLRIDPTGNVEDAGDHVGALSVRGKNHKGRQAWGYAWIMRREVAWQEWNVLGSGDVFNWVSWLNVKTNVHTFRSGDKVRQHFLETIDPRACGWFGGIIRHYWHGERVNRQYGIRHTLLKEHDFDPKQDVFIDENGLLAWTDRQKELPKYVKQYFYSRFEDG